jgi:hypothetical protein
MKPERLSIDRNGVVGGAVVALIILLDAAFASTHWAVWIHWKWTAIVGHFVGITLAVCFVGAFSHQITEHLVKDESGNRIERSRIAAYALCCVMVLSFSVVAGLIVAAPVEPGDEMESTHQVATEYRPPMPEHKRDALIEKIFWVSLLPALFGVRIALGPKQRRDVAK